MQANRKTQWPRLQPAMADGSKRTASQHIELDVDAVPEGAFQIKSALSMPTLPRSSTAGRDVVLARAETTMHSSSSAGRIPLKKNYLLLMYLGTVQPLFMKPQTMPQDSY